MSGDGIIGNARKGKKVRNRRPDSAINPEPGFVRKTLAHAMKCQAMPKIDLADPAALKGRIDWYFKACIEDDVRPGVEGLCTALHCTRQTFNEYANGHKRAGQGHQELARDAKQLLADMMEQYLMNGEINPVAGIFLASNQFDYDRNATVTVQTQQVLPAAEDPARLAQKYAADVIDVSASPTPEKIETIAGQADK